MEEDGEIIDYDFDRYLDTTSSAVVVDPAVSYLTSLVQALNVAKAPPPVVIPPSQNVFSMLQNLLPLSQQLTQPVPVPPTPVLPINNKLFIHPSRQNQIRSETQTTTSQPEKRQVLNYVCECGCKWKSTKLETKYVRKKCRNCGVFRVSLEAIGIDSVASFRDNKIILK